MKQHLMRNVANDLTVLLITVKPRLNLDYLKIEKCNREIYYKLNDPNELILDPST